MKRNFLKISLFLIGVFTCFSCEASTTYSSSSSDGVGESIPTAQQWNKDVVGWNLGNEFECSAPGQDGESMQIGNPDGSIHAETAWG
ncbi:MAG: glycoside hydrolase family 5 protein, partial [Prevotella sp.]|nr:glycoside hydrolase family 5 protein [Prevotella sp.]